MRPLLFSARTLYSVHALIRWPDFVNDFLGRRTEIPVSAKTAVPSRRSLELTRQNVFSNLFHVLRRLLKLLLGASCDDRSVILQVVEGQMIHAVVPFLA